ncbi:hypothetical protein LIER_10494 [Lithospermum erythrorhizon]|uniref:Uncharacterized protein n=1 Tax=Lithospermum erythrorhizon TaxID=34254 RepID=A0AAV3PLI8_LITER
MQKSDGKTLMRSPRKSPKIEPASNKQNLMLRLQGRVQRLIWKNGKLEEIKLCKLMEWTMILKLKSRKICN